MAKTPKTNAKLYQRKKTVKGKEYEYWIARDSYNGRPVECSAPTQLEALQGLTKKLSDLESGVVGITSKMTVKRWAEKWLETYKKPSVSDATYADYKRQVEKSIVPEIGSLRLTEVTDVHLQEILNKKAGMSESRVKMLYLTIRGIFKQAYDSKPKLLSTNLAEGLEMPKFTSGTHRSITDFERQHFLKVAETHHAGMMFKMMLYCGLRTGEVVALRWRDFDFVKKRVKISRAMKSGTDEIGDPKSKAGFREIPIPDEIYSELIGVRGDPDSPVFTRPRSNERHNQSSREAAWRSFKNQLDRSMGAVFVKKKAKDGKMRATKALSVVAPDFVPYCLRHTFCTDLQRKRVPINIAKYLMGHEDISVTAKIYTHMTDDVIDDAAELINGKSRGKNSSGQAKGA